MPLTIDLPPDVLAALRGRAAARGRTPEEEALAALAASVDVLFNPPAPQPDDDRRTDPGAVAPAERLRADAHPPPPAKPPEGSLADYLRTHEGVEDDLSDAEWDAYWWTLEFDGEAALAGRGGFGRQPTTDASRPPETEPGPERAAA